MDVINEQTRRTIYLSFSDETGIPVTPSKITWNLDDPDTGSPIVNNAIVFPTGPTHQLVITAAQNACSALGKDVETRRVTVIAEDLAATEHLYHIRRLKGAA